MPGVLGIVQRDRSPASLASALLSLSHLPTYRTRELEVAPGITLGEALPREPMFAHSEGGSTERRQLNAVAASALVRRRDDEAGGSNFAAMGAKMRDAIAHWVEKARGQAH